MLVCRNLSTILMNKQEFAPMFNNGNEHTNAFVGLCTPSVLNCRSAHLTWDLRFFLYFRPYLILRTRTVREKSEQQRVLEHGNRV